LARETWIMGAIAALAIIALVIVAVPRGVSSSSRHLIATGSATVTVVPDEGIVSLGVHTRATTVSAAQARNDHIMARVQSALGALGIPKKDIQTQNYNVGQTYGPHGAPNGYEVDDGVAVTVQSAKLAGRAITAATKAGANEVNGVSWTVSNPTKYTGKAYALALDRAKATAQRLAAGLGVHLVAVASVEVTTVPQVQPVMMATGEAAPVQPGTAPVMASLRVVFDYN